MPVDDYLSKWAYIVITSLAWNLKCLFDRSYPVDR
jgi:hypothetical protein